ncbi:hypothetical protein GCM10007385_43490 [Tateyamaria omphalii]|uniref:GNAT family N-acetyltransferase n=1 Tax=Tateyamaria omphalii TaxID=299262 RepID=UPI001675DEA9|nr:GNAT family N-acetyltransferase [Tateyamaria omphalii]GGX69572.1 hypothetical protein GCM10007385_43490 [Tateyamaria omphalii]
MSVVLTRLSRADTPWLHAVVAPYFAELVPGFGPLEHDRFDIWWNDADRAVYAIEADQSRAGFALIRKCDDDHHEISEFCVLPNARSRGIGAQAAVLCLALHSGPWRIGVAATLTGTARFWDRVLTTAPGINGLEKGPALTPYQCHSYTFTYRDIQ